MRRVLFGFVTAGAPVVLIHLAPPRTLALEWTSALHPTAAASTGPAAFGAVDAATGVLGWLLAGWLLAIVTTTCLGAAPGRAGALARTIADSITPTLLRGVLGAGLGVGLVGGIGVASAPVALHTAASASLSSAAVTLPSAPTTITGATPTGCPGPSDDIAPALDWPAPGWCPTPVALPRPYPVPAAPRADRGGASSGPYRVRAGDSLWSIARSQLGPHSDSAEIAASWPRWWAANRTLIGSDPGLLRPGTVLVPPD